MCESLSAVAEAYAKQYFRGEASGHDWQHTARVCHLAEELCREEGADLEIVRLAALLHDVDDRKLSPQTTEGLSNASSFLDTICVPEDVKEQVLRIIREVSFRGTDSVVPSTVEGKCVQDADRLDAMGAIGIARTFTYGGSRGRPIYDPDDKPLVNMSAQEYYSRQSSSINHFYEKLLLLKEQMNTSSGRRIAERRDSFMRSFLDEFFEEIGEEAPECAV